MLIVFAIGTQCMLEATTPWNVWKTNFVPLKAIPFCIETNLIVKKVIVGNIESLKVELCVICKKKPPPILLVVSLFNYIKILVSNAVGLLLVQFIQVVNFFCVEWMVFMLNTQFWLEIDITTEICRVEFYRNVAMLYLLWMCERQRSLPNLWCKDYKMKALTNVATVEQATALC